MSYQALPDADGSASAMTIIKVVAMQCRVIAKRSLVQSPTLTWVWGDKVGKDMSGR
jgi:hypothetical protein